MLITIPGFLIALLTFPGVIIHEFAHRFFCDIFNVKVFNVNYFCLQQDTVGYVLHEKNKNHFPMALISLAPLLINTICCMVFTLAIASKIHFDIPTANSGFFYLLHLFLGWVGFSTGFHAIPSNKDAEALTELSQSFLTFIPFSFIRALICVSNLDYIGFWVRIGYIYVISQILPSILFG